MTVKQLLLALGDLPDDCLDLPIRFDCEEGCYDIRPPFVVNVDANGKPTLEATMFSFVDVGGDHPQK